MQNKVTYLLAISTSLNDPCSKKLWAIDFVMQVSSVNIFIGAKTNIF